MKRNITLTLVFLLTGLSVSLAQNQSTLFDKHDLASRYQAAQKYTDPSFPLFQGSGDPYADKVFMNKMEEYAKLHPPCPMMRHTGNDAFDLSNFETQTSKWIGANPFFPRFIEYHLFNKLLTPGDDLEIYNNAVEAWKKQNPDKISEIFPEKFENNNNSSNH